MLAKGLKEFVNNVQVKPFVKPIKIQMLEINGQQEFEKGLYHNQNYENLIKQLNQTRVLFRKSVQIEERKQIASQEIKLWNQYADFRRTNLNDEFQINQKMISNLKQIWDLIKSRNQQTIKPQKMLEFHMEYAKTFKFEVPLEAKCLQQLIHPHYGYLSNFPNDISFETLINIYQNKLLASYEKSLGQTLLGEELCALTYWNQFDTKQQGYMELEQFCDFIQVFKFSLKDLNSIKKEFSFAIKQFPGEFHRDIDSKQDIIRFDLLRYIFLERNL